MLLIHLPREQRLAVIGFGNNTLSSELQHRTTVPPSCYVDGGNDNKMVKDRLLHACTLTEKHENKTHWLAVTPNPSGKFAGFDTILHRQTLPFRSHSAMKGSNEDGLQAEVARLQRR